MSSSSVSVASENRGWAKARDGASAATSVRAAIRQYGGRAMFTVSLWGREVAGFAADHVPAIDEVEDDLPAAEGGRSRLAGFGQRAYVGAQHGFGEKEFREQGLSVEELVGYPHDLVRGVFGRHDVELGQYDFEIRVGIHDLGLIGLGGGARHCQGERRRAAYEGPQHRMLLVIDIRSRSRD